MSYSLPAGFWRLSAATDRLRLVVVRRQSDQIRFTITVWCKNEPVALWRCEVFYKVVQQHVHDEVVRDFGDNCYTLTAGSHGDRVVKIGRQ